MSTTTAGLHRGYSCPSLVSAKPTKPIQHSLSVSLSACQEQHQHYHHYHHHHHPKQQQPSQLQNKQKQIIDLDKEEAEEENDEKPNEERRVVLEQQDDSVISPLTEANLKEHTTKTAYGRESRHRRVKCYVDSQVQLLRLEAELERRRRMEIRSLVPLDTHSYDQDVILSAYDYYDYHAFNDDEDDNNSDNSNHSENQRHRQKSPSKRSSFSQVRRWFSLRKSSTSALRANKAAAAAEQADKKKKKRHTISFEQYQQDKAALVGQGLNGLSNQNIARALGAGGLASLVFSPPPSPADGSQITSVITTTASQQQQQQQQHHNHQKRDSGVSLFSRSTSKKGGSGDHHVVPGQEQQQQQQQQQQHNNNQSAVSRSNSFVTARYPKMIHLKTLRGAAIQALSSDFSLGEESIYCCTNSSDLPNCCCPR